MVDPSRAAYYAGISAVVLSHAYILANGMGKLTLDQHAWLNIVAAALIAFSFARRFAASLGVTVVRDGQAPSTLRARIASKP